MPYSNHGPCLKNIYCLLFFSNWHINLGDIQSQEQRDILLTLTLHAAPSSANPTPILKTSVNYL